MVSELTFFFLLNLLSWLFLSQCLNEEQADTGIYHLIKLNSTKTKCLDGSQPAFYYRQEDSSQRWLIYFEDGGFCGGLTLDSTLANCYLMSQTSFGSSNTYQSEINLDNKGILSSLYQNNKYYYMFNTVYIKSCDGSLYQGYNEDPYIYNNSFIWFRGFTNINETLNYVIETLKMSSGSEIAVAGCQTGGLATIMWVDNISQKMSNYNSKAKIYGIPDNGILMNEVDMTSMDYQFQTKVMNLMQYSNDEMDPPIHKCNSDYPDDLWKCLFAEYFIFYIDSDLFVVQSEYDLWTIQNIMGISCAEDCSLSICSNATRILINKYRKDLINLVNNVKSKYEKWGFWLPACVHNCFCGESSYNNDSFAVPMKSGNNAESSLLEWRIEENTTLIDEEQWPSNLPCSNEK